MHKYYYYYCYYCVQYYQNYTDCNEPCEKKKNAASRGGQTI